MAVTAAQTPSVGAGAVPEAKPHDAPNLTQLPRHLVLRSKYRTQITDAGDAARQDPPTAAELETLMHSHMAAFARGNFWQCVYAPDRCRALRRTVWGMRLHVAVAHGAPAAATDTLRPVRRPQLCEELAAQQQAEEAESAQWLLPLVARGDVFLAAADDAQGVYGEVVARAMIVPAPTPPPSPSGPTAVPSFVESAPASVVAQAHDRALRFPAEAGSRLNEFYAAKPNPSETDRRALARYTGLQPEQIMRWFSQKWEHVQRKEAEALAAAEAAAASQQQASAGGMTVLTTASGAADGAAEDGGGSGSAGGATRRQQLTPEQRAALFEVYAAYNGELPHDAASREQLANLVQLPWKTVRNWFNNRKYRPMPPARPGDAGSGAPDGEEPRTGPAGMTVRRRGPGRPPNPPLFASGPAGRGQGAQSLGLQTAEQSLVPGAPPVYGIRISWGYDRRGRVLGVRAPSTVAYPPLPGDVARLVLGNTVTLDMHVTGLYYAVDHPVPWTTPHPLAPFFQHLSRSPVRVGDSISTRDAVDLWTQFFVKDKLARPDKHYGINSVYLLQIEQAVKQEPTGQKLIQHLASLMHACEQACLLRGNGFQLLLTLPKDDSNTFIGLLRFDRMPSSMYTEVAKFVMQAQQQRGGSAAGPSAASVPSQPPADSAVGDSGLRLPPLQSLASSSFLTPTAGEVGAPAAEPPAEPAPAQAPAVALAVPSGLLQCVNTIHNIEFAVSIRPEPWLDAPASVQPTLPEQSALVVRPVTTLADFIKRLIATFHNQRIAGGQRGVRVYREPAAPGGSTTYATVDTEWEQIGAEDIGLRFFDKNERHWLDAFGGPVAVTLETLQRRALKLACELV